MDLLTTHQQKALNFEKHISLTANAGSGKTFVLARRYLEIALAENGSLREIAAITFTDKAASELYRKIAEHAEERLGNSTDEEEKKLLNIIRRQLVSANISTIHSFCLDILRQFPVEAGLDANFQPIDEIVSDELIELSVDETIKDALSGGPNASETKYLIRLFGSKFIFSSRLGKLIKDRKRVFELQDKIYSRDRDVISRYFYDTFIETAGQLILLNQDKFIEALSAINESVLSVDKNNNIARLLDKLLTELSTVRTTEEKIALIGLIKENGFTKGGEVKRQKYLSSNLREGLSVRIQTSERYIGELNSFAVPANHIEIESALAGFGKSIIQLFDLALKKYKLKKEENGYLDYEDILILTKNLLSIPAVKSELTRKYKYVMVDEYQDTNEIQYKIFLPILDDLKEGNLFVVGDEKQSIYMFRDADLEVFRMTKEKISGTSGEKFLLSLPDSFRMAPGICLFVNTLFRSLFSDPVDLYNEVTHSDIVCAKQDDTDSLIEILIGDSLESKEEERISEAELVADRIISLVNGDDGLHRLNWRDIAVLVRKRKSFSLLEKTFIGKNIPFNIVGGKGFFQRQSIYDIFNYFSFLLDTRNDTALVGILRSPFFTISDSSIYELSLQRGKTLWQKLADYRDKDKKLVNAFEILTADISRAAVMTAPELLRRILDQSPYLSVLARKASGDQETANISKLVRMTIDFQSKGYKTLYDYVNFLKESIQDTEDEPQAATADESDSVKVMTIHQAKGLEFPAVFLYNAHEVTISERVRKGSIQIDKKFGLLTKVPLNNDYFGEYYQSPVNKLFDYISSKKERAELKRLFYVAVTRAKNYLFISAPDMKKYKSDSFMALLQTGLNIDFTRESFFVKDELNFLKKEDNRYVNFSEVLEEKINIIRNTDTSPLQAAGSPKTDSIKQMMLSKVSAVPKGEIISATKFASYKQCPLKYSLIYELGLSDIVRNYRKYKSGKLKTDTTGFEFSPAELSAEEEPEVRTISAELKGSIVHKILQRNNPDIPLPDIVDIIKEEDRNIDDKTAGTLGVEIFGKLQKLYKSDNYKSLSGYKKSFNEYEIYLNREDYFLHGIIDKLIIDDKRAIIIDYKTDSVQKEEILNRAAIYFPQLKFYSYIVSCLYEQLTSFELRLIFINLPGEEVKLMISHEEALSFGSEIKEMVGRIRLKEFDRDLSHCKECNFAVTNSKCIVEWA